MSMIQVSHLTFSYPGSYDTIFSDVSFTLDTDWKLGFVGRNGRGKTTFLKLLKKELPFEGNIAASVLFDYFPMQVPDKAADTLDVADGICPGLEQWQLLRELSLLDVADDVLYRPFESLSGGEQVKVLLAALFLQDNHFLLIDEPTNHLDLEARAVVGRYLSRKSGFILVSHDRAFLDVCVDHILSINKQDIEVVKGNFSSWWQNKENRDNLEREQDRILKKDIDRLNTAAQRTAVWSDKVEQTKYGTYNSGLKVDRGYIGAKSAKMMKRAKVTEARAIKAASEKEKLLKNVESNETLKIHPLHYHSDPLVSLRDVALRYGDRPVCGDMTLEIRRGDRIALRGKNGSGKTTLLKLLLGEPIAHTGAFSVASGLKISYVSQDTSHLRGGLHDYAAARAIDETLFKTILRKMDFSRVQFEKDMTDFSSGQKKKVLLAASLCEQAHLYLWDEPLNFIDVLSRIQVETLLLQYSPTMLFVEHDAAFCEAVATKTIRIGV